MNAAAATFVALCALALFLPSSGQFFDGGDGSAGRGLSIDPFLLQALKSKYPKKYNAKLDFAKDLALDAKQRLNAAKLLARHMKNLNSINCDIQNLMYQQQQQQQQPGLLQPFDQSSLLAQQPQVANFQIPFDVSRYAPQTDPQIACFPQVADPRQQQQQQQQQAYQLAQSNRSARQESPSSSEESPEEEGFEHKGFGYTSPESKGPEEKGPRPDLLTSALSTFFGVVKSILK